MEMPKALTDSKLKWPDQIPLHIKKKLFEIGKDYCLRDVINICEEIIELYDQDSKGKWDGINVSDVMMSTVTFNNKFRRYL
jgi:hypothetical protein